MTAGPVRQKICTPAVDVSGVEVPASSPRPSSSAQRPSPVSIPRVRPAAPSDDRALVDVANRAFGRVDPRHRPYDEALWRWKYRAGPEPGCSVLATDAAGRVRGHYGALGQRLLVGGDAVRVTHAADSLARAPAGPGLAAVRGFLAAGRAFAEAADATDAFTWGLPVARAARLGERFLGYHRLRPQLALVAPVGSLDLERSRLPRSLEARVADDVPSTLDGLARTVRAVHPERASFARDRAWYRWRFLDHPRERFELFRLDDARGCRGLAVYRQGGFDRFRGGLLCDWLVPADDDDAARALLAAVARRARFDGARVLIALWPESAPEWSAFERAGFRAHVSRYPLTVRAWAGAAAAGIDERWLRERWTYTLGDTDLC